MSGHWICIPSLETYTPEEIEEAYDQMTYHWAEEYQDFPKLLEQLRENKKRIYETAIITSASSGPTEVAP